jgi:predicted glycosyltransferase
MRGFILTGMTEKGNAAIRALDIKDKKAFIVLRDTPEGNAQLKLEFFIRFRVLPLLKESSEVFIHRYMNDKGLARSIDYDIEFY